MAKPNRTKSTGKNRARVHRARVKAARRRRIGPHRETAQRHAARRLRVAARSRRFTRR